MADFATSDDPKVQAQLNRLAALSLPQGRFGLETIRGLLRRLGDPQRRIPPAFHVAGTNGKGSTCAFLRAILEAQGLRVHATTSPHLVRYNERIRIAGRLIGDEELAATLAEVLDVAEGLSISFFEVTIAAAFLAFSRHEADACVIETGLGGRFDATNVLEHPLACGIATLGIDHERFLLAPEAGTPEEPLARIAFEKAGIRRAGVPLVTQRYDAATAAILHTLATADGVPLRMRGEAWDARRAQGSLRYEDANGVIDLPLPSMAGAHQADNAALAVAMLRHQRSIPVRAEAMAEGIRRAKWPARLQLLGQGPLTALVPEAQVWLDGGHNRDAGLALIGALKDRGMTPHIVLGMIEGKNAGALLEPLRGIATSVTIVPVPGHASHPPEAFTSFVNDLASAGSVEQALMSLNARKPSAVLIAGSLYLAGDVLRRNGEPPE